jgi:hypothetical protein
MPVHDIGVRIFSGSYFMDLYVVSVNIVYINSCDFGRSL